MKTLYTLINVRLLLFLVIVYALPYGLGNHVNCIAELVEVNVGWLKYGGRISVFFCFIY